MVTSNPLGRQAARPSLPALTTLRFFAALYVFVFHGCQPYFTSPVAKSFVGTGYVAVDFFFVLSGFVLTYRYCNEAGQFSATRRDFWAARFARVYPVYVMSLALGAPLYVGALMESNSFASATMKAVVTAVVALFLGQSWFYRTATSWNPPAWSLSVEAFLYLAFPFVMPRLVGMMHIRSSARRMTLLLLIWLVAMVAPVAYLIASPDGLAHVTLKSDGNWLNTLRFTPLFHLPAFMLGIGAGAWHLKRDGTTPRWLGAALGGLMCVLLCLGAWLPYPLIHTGLFAPIFAAVIYCAAGSRSPFIRALEAKPLVALGDASYALYLLHFPILQYAEKLAGGGLSVLQVVMTYVVLQLTCVAVYRYIEAPSRSRIRRLLARNQDS